MSENSLPSKLPAKPVTKAKKLKARNLTKLVIESGGNLAEVARRRGVSRQAIQEQVAKNPEVQNIMCDLMDRHGVTDTVLAKKLHTLIHAQKMVDGWENEEKEDGTTKAVRTLVPTDDLNVQLKATELCLKVKGHIKTGGDVVVDNSKKVVQLFGDLKDETIDGMSTASLINEINGRLSRQRA